MHPERRRADAALGTASDVAPRVWLGASVAVILLAVVPWTDFVSHSHWGKVQWVPFLSPPVTIQDIVGNVSLYLPFGYAYARQRTRQSGVLSRVAGFAAVLSLLTEWTQLYSHSRFPSVQDAACNVVGAMCGAWWAKSQWGGSGHRHTVDGPTSHDT